MKKIVIPILIFYFLISMNRCSRTFRTGILNDSKYEITLTLKLKTPISKSEFLTTILEIPSNADHNHPYPTRFFRVPANQNSDLDRFDRSKLEAISSNEISYSHTLGEIKLKLQPRFAYFFLYSRSPNEHNVHSIENHGSIQNRFSEIRIDSQNISSILRQNVIHSLFPYNENCECFLWIIK
ncbi:hypothetical protein [Leptospira noguchii]|uniref:Uncharacterized protein n=1 Tax=Leptospira noguchii TaxID=28182 RepID=M6VDM2_9LEPT|nr:hypothetical protein [Leptospira noguchii]EMO55542.1 hypothetical protein LEP1GSC172_1383 [Leptospira noguchii]